MASRRLDPARTLSERPSGYADTSVAWEAALVQPGRMLEGSSQVFVVDVLGPAMLDMGISIQVGEAKASAEWQGELGQHRRCIAILSPKRGVHRVLVRVEGMGREIPILEAGKIIVAAR